MASFNFFNEHPLFFIPNEFSKDTTKKFTVSLPNEWHKVEMDDEWDCIILDQKKIPRQGWKVHVSASLDDAKQILKLTSDVCFQLNISFKYLNTEKKFKLRNGKHTNRGFSGKFITCYPNVDQLEKFLSILESKLIGLNGPYILSDKRWKKAPIYLRYGVFRETYPNEDFPTNSRMIKTTHGNVVDQRDPFFSVPDGVEVPDFLQEWLDSKGEEIKDLPFVINSALQFSNCGGVYVAMLTDSLHKVVLKEARPYTGIDNYSLYATDRLKQEKRALEELHDIQNTPKIYWFGEVWEHLYLAMEKVEGKLLNRWVTENFPIVSLSKNLYLENIKNILTQLINVIKEAHKKSVYHQDIHLHNIIINENQKIYLIDWGEVRFENKVVPFHQTAAPGFRAWGENLTPEEIDWYGVLQIGYFLFYPIILTADLVYDFGEQTCAAGRHYYEELGYTDTDINEYLDLLSDIKRKVKKNNKTLSINSNLKPYQIEHEKLDIDVTIQKLGKKLLDGADLVKQTWQHEYKFREFPVLYYGINSKQGIAFSDLGVLMAYKRLANFLGEEKYKNLDSIEQKIINNSIYDFSRAKNQPLGLLNGFAGTCWLLSQLGYTNLSQDFINVEFPKMIQNSQSQNLYDGLTGILLTGLYFFNRRELSDKNSKLLLNKLQNFALDYHTSANHLFITKDIDQLTNHPTKQRIGLFYGHAGLGWLFSEAYKLTKDKLFLNCFNLAIGRELINYVSNNNGSLQCQQGHRTLPYLATGSAGLGILIARNKQYVSEINLAKLKSLYYALETNFSVFPGLYNGLTGLKISQMYINKHLHLGQSQIIKESFVNGIQPHFIKYKNGLTVAGDNGTKITMDVFSGFAGVALAIPDIMEQTFNILPTITKK